jgi:hypothetical protein
MPVHRPPIDLNRELPPLPSLDSWKDEEPVPRRSAPEVKPPGPDARTAPVPNVSTFPTLQGLRRVVSRSSLAPGREDAGLAQHPAMRYIPGPMGDHESLRAPRGSMGSSMSSASMGYALSSMGTSQSAETTADPAVVHAKSRARNLVKKFSRSNMTRKFSIDSQATSEQERISRKPYVADYSRTTGPPLSGTARSWSRVGMRASDVPAHSREQSTSTMQSDEHIYVNEARFSHVLSVPSRPQSNHDSGRKHWWHNKEKDKPISRKGSWMDEVARSGARHGILIPDHVSGAPVVRF